MPMGKSNYVAWKFRIMRILKEKGLARVLENSPADDPTSDIANTEQVNEQVFTIISLNIHDCNNPNS